MIEDQKPAKKTKTKIPPSDIPEMDESNSDESSSVESLVKASLKEAADFTAEETTTPAPTSRMSEFAKTPMAAKLSGTYHETTGKLKRKFGEYTKDPLLKEEGLNQELLGKVHRLVGSIRTIRVAAREKFESKKVEGRQLLRKHSLKLLDVANEIADDVRNLILK
jgi:uncharacterized protein YjbJ (UPF0337 family)